MNTDPEESEGTCYTHAANISTEARANRQLLGAVLTAAGLVKHPTEWCSQSSLHVQLRDR